MQNPLASLTSALLGPPYDEQVRLTWAKRDLAQGTLDAMHEILQTSTLTSAEDQEAFKRSLASYAGFTYYVAALGDQLTQMNGGQPVDDKPLASSAVSWLTKDLMTSLSQQIESEVNPFIAQWEGALSAAAPSSWVQRVQQSKPQLVKDDAVLDGTHGRE
jgi:hypothetical protein